MNSSARKLTDKYIIAMLLLFPLWTGLEGYADITRWKFTFFAVFTGIWVALLIFFAVRERARPRCPKAFALLGAAFAVWAAVSALASGFGSRLLLGWHYDGLLPMLLYLAAALGVASYGEWHDYYVNLLAVSVTLCCAVALMQLAGLNPLRLYPDGLDYYDSGVKYSGSFLGTMGNTNVLGSFLCLTCPLFAYTALQRRGRSLWLLAPAALSAAVLALSRSEAGLVGALAALLLGVVYYVNQLGRRRAALMLLAAEAAAVCVFLAFVYFSPPEGGTLYELGELLHGRVRDSFGSSRVAVWREALRLFAARPVLGGGPGSFGLRSTLEFSRYVAESGITLTTRADNAHCEALEYLVDLGLPGCALYLSLAFFVFRRWMRGALPAAGTALLAYFVQGLFSSGTCFVLPIVCIFSGLTAGAGEPLRPGDRAVTGIPTTNAEASAAEERKQHG